MDETLFDTQQAPGAPLEEGQEMELYVAPASFAQRRLWLLDRIQPGSTAYNVPMGIRLRGPLEASVLADALAELVMRHETLRTAFDEEEGEPVQLIAPELRPELLEIDLSAFPDAEAEARRLADEEARRPFDLRRAPLLRASLLRLAEDDHLLLLSLHHVVTDGWSLGILLRELPEIYAAFVAGLPSPLPDLPIQYADFAAWQQQWLQGEVLEQKLRPWRQRLAGAPAGLDLPTDRPRLLDGPAEGRAGFLPTALGAPLSADLRQLARSSGATLFMTLLAGFQTLLFRHSGQPDLVVGSPVANRNRLEIEGIIGFFVNTLALRGDLSGDPTFRQLLERVREVAVEAFAHEDLPFEKLVEELRPDRRTQQNPIFPVLFAVQQKQGLPAASAEDGGLRWELAEVHPGTAKLDLTLQLVDDPAGIHGSWEFDADLFDAATIERLGRHLRVLLADAAAHPDRRLSELAVLSPGERHQIEVEWNDSRSAWPRHETIPRLVAAQAARTPDADALISVEGTVTYRDLVRRARRLGRHLRALGVGIDRPVGVFVERGAAMVETWLGVLEAGGAYIPLDPGYPAERLAFMLRDAQVACVVTSRELAQRLPAQSAPLLYREDLTPDGDLPEGPVGAAEPDSLAYVIYTSGSTGLPKGVAVSHSALIRTVRDTNYAEFPPADRVAQVSNASFDPASFEVWGALIHGAPLVLIEPDVATSPEDLSRALNERGIGTAFLTSSLFHRMASEWPAAFRSMRQLLVGGEAVDPSRAAEVLAAGGPERLINAYGPTESTVFACTHTIREVPAGASSVPIGRPVANTTALVLDAALRPVPVGVAGELWLGGDGLARGYLGRPELTAERFVPDPLAYAPGARLYRTGDRARLLPDGTVDYLGRIDRQVKIRGFRIEPGEIEVVLAAHPAVAECAVEARRNAVGELALIAWFVPRRSPAPTMIELRSHLQGSLPEPLLPSAYIELDALPRTPNGKLDRAALPEPDAIGAATSGFVPPRTPVEEVLASIWASVLRVERIGATDNFFDLGGHSLTATAVTSLVRSTFQVELPTRAIFKEPTLADMAELIEKLLLSREGLELPPVTPASRGPESPLSFAQQRLWFLDELAGGASPFYNISAALLLTGTLDPGALGRALDEIVSRHEALRTTFRTGPAGTPLQVIQPHRPFPLSVADLAGLPPLAREAEARRLAREDADHPFSLIRGPLLRTTLLRLEENRQVVLLCMHHIVSDGWSLEIFVGELATLYRAFVAGKPSPLAALPVQYADFAVWQRSQLSGPVLDAQLAFWRQQLAGIPLVFELPTDRPRPARQTHRAGHVDLHIPAELIDRLNALARQNRGTLFMVLLTTFATLLRRTTGRRDLLVGTPIANRNRSETAGLIGFFVNLLILRADLGGNPEFTEALGRVREMALGAYAHQDLPFERLVEELQPARDLSRHPLFQVALTLSATPWHALDLPGVTLGSLDVPIPVEHHDLTLQAHQTSYGLEAGFSYNADLFDAATVQRLGRYLEILLESFVADARQRVDSVSLLTGEERAQLLESLRPSADALPQDALIVELFERQAASQPAAPAMLWDGGEISYEELDRRSNRLAWHLRSLGVGTEVPVALCLDRTVDHATALLAVWKAGGTILPLDPKAPRGRLGWMLRDSQARVAVTRAELAPLFDLAETTVVRLDADRAALARHRADPLPAGTDPDHSATCAAYILYTSGSTGTPKGVVVPHGAFASHCLEAARRWGLSPEDRVLQTAAFVFDVSLEEMLSTWIAGAAVVPWEAARGPEELSRVLAREEITVVQLPAPLWHQAAREWASGRIPVAAPSLRLMIVGAEVQPPESLALWRRTPLGHVAFANEYGTTETTITATFHEVSGSSEAGADLFRMGIGRPLSNRSVILQDEAGEPVPAGIPGEVCIGGPTVARGYLGRPDLTAAAFVPDPWNPTPGARLYRTGDLARRRADGVLEFIGRRDGQLKLRGHRIEAGEVEAALLKHPSVQAAAVAVIEGDGTPETRALGAWLIPAAGQAVSAGALREHMRALLPATMVPTSYSEVAALPLNANGKVDRAALSRLAPTAAPRPEPLAQPAAPEPAVPSVPQPAPQDSLDDLVASLWKEALALDERDQVDPDDNFFDLGGHSMLLGLIRARLQESLGTDVPMIDMFNYPTVRTLAASLRRQLGDAAPAPRPEAPRPEAAPRKSTDIAIIGMAGQLPGARNVDQLWRNLVDGVESITFFGPEGDTWQSPEGKLHHVPARGIVTDADRWDAAFFGYSAREAELMDPQHRLFLECAWQALESAGYPPGRTTSSVGVFGSATRSDYLALLVASGARSDLPGTLMVGVGNDRDFITTRVSYKLNLEGPSYNVQTACSSSLVAVHVACLNLLAGECEMAIAGGASIGGQPEAGYMYQDGGTLSPDGRCRAFDAQGKGSVDSDGVGIVVLKRLEDALADGDHVHAVIKASGTNNDGSEKVGFLAPRAASQGKLIRATLEKAGISADTVTFVEAHGNGTPLGDPLEVAGLTEAFRAHTPRVGYCALGSVKTNIGNVNGASGVAGLIKAALALENRLIPATLHFEQPNPALHLETSPFFVNNTPIPWEVPEGLPRRAGVTSLGAGGSKAHVVLEEAPPLPERVEEPGAWHLLVLSARTPTALERATAELADWLESHPGLLLTDVAFTLQTGRRAFEHRRAVLCRGHAEAIAALRSGAAGQPDESTLPEPARALLAQAQRWLAGQEVDGSIPPPRGIRPLRVPLPTYPFDKQRHWVEAHGPDVPRFTLAAEPSPEPELSRSGK
jgi:amino acid adenylation domain-containing protein